MNRPNVKEKSLMCSLNSELIANDAENTTDIYALQFGYMLDGRFDDDVVSPVVTALLLLIVQVDFSCSQTGK